MKNGFLKIKIILIRNFNSIILAFLNNVVVVLVSIDF